jgi:ABC-type branched-subunit amino acid transport system permease subunit
MRAVKDSEVAAESIGLDPVRIKTAAFAISAFCAGVGGRVLLRAVRLRHAVDVRVLAVHPLRASSSSSAAPARSPARSSARAIVVLLPEFLAALAEYRLLFFGALLLRVLWLAPDGVVGLFERWLARRRKPRLALSL